MVVLRRSCRIARFESEVFATSDYRSVLADI